jgi:hypothetical protein
VIGADGKWAPDFAKEFPTIAAKYTDPRTALKSMVELNSMLGKQGKVSPITPTSGPEEIAAFRKATGVPDTVEGYAITPIKEVNGKPLPEGAWDDGLIKGYLAEFHRLGVPSSVANELIKYGITKNAEGIEKLNSATQAYVDESMARLKTDWGSSYEANVAMAERGAAVLGVTKEMIQADPMLSSNPTFLRAMKAAGAMIREGQSPGARGGQQSITDPSVRLKELQAQMGNPNYKKSAAYLNHEANMAEMRGLLAQKESMRG